MDSFKLDFDRAKQNKKDGSLQILNDVIGLIMKYLESDKFYNDGLKEQLEMTGVFNVTSSVLPKTGEKRIEKFVQTLTISMICAN